MSPPGKNKGQTTCASVLIESCKPAAGSSAAASSPAKRCVIECGQEGFLNELMRHPPARAMSHHDLFVMRQGRRADRPFYVHGFIAHDSEFPESFKSFCIFFNPLISYL